MNTFNGGLRLRIPIAVALLSIALVCFVYLVPFSSTQASPNCNETCELGYTLCVNWCLDHNKTTKSREQCGARCEAYWHSGKNPQSIGLGDPSNPPRKGPGNISGLPVSNPTPTPRKGPGGISGLPESNPTPTPRKGPGKIGTTGIGHSSPTPTPSGPVLLEKKSGKPTPTPKPAPKKGDHH
jgi:hypothetical protein